MPEGFEQRVRIVRGGRSAITPLTRLREQWLRSFAAEPFARLAGKHVELIRLGFARRHILEHNGGRADERYLKESGDTVAIGRPVRYGPAFVRDSIEALEAAAGSLEASCS